MTRTDKTMLKLFVGALCLIVIVVSVIYWSFQ